MNEYEKLRLKNIADNRRILAEIGLANPFKKLPRVTFKKAIQCKTTLKRKADTQLDSPAKKFVIEEDLDSCGSLRGSRRRSARIQGKDTPTEDELNEEIEAWEKENDGPKKVPPNRPNTYGAIEGVEVGTVWPTRMESCRAGIHRPTVAGIHAGPEGAYSIALSGGYDDNVDLGEGFTYTGEGGRDLKGTKSNPKNLRTAPQSKDQELTRGNLALSKNVTSGHPVRVIRGYKLNSPFAPEDGYRYDGLYQVEKAWFTTGLSGFGVWKFALRRCMDQAPPPWTLMEVGSPSKDSTTSDRNEGEDKLSENGKSDSGFDSDETSSHLGSQDSDITSSQGSTSSGVEQETGDVCTPPEHDGKSLENAEDGETEANEECNEKNEEKLTAGTDHTEMSEDKNENVKDDEENAE